MCYMKGSFFHAPSNIVVLLQPYATSLAGLFPRRSHSKQTLIRQQRPRLSLSGPTLGLGSNLPLQCLRIDPFSTPGDRGQSQPDSRASTAKYYNESTKPSWSRGGIRRKHAVEGDWFLDLEETVAAEFFDLANGSTRRVFGPIIGNNKVGRKGKLRCTECRNRRAKVINIVICPLILVYLSCRRQQMRILRSSKPILC